MSKESPLNPGLKYVQKPSPYNFFGVPTAEDQKMLQVMNKGWNRWDATRRINPLIEEQSATGFEGYFIGLGFPPQEVAIKIAELGSQSIQYFKRLHRSNAGYISRVWKVARGELYDLSILRELNACLLANSARLRMQVLPQRNVIGDQFRNGVAKLVEAETIHFHSHHGVVTDHTIAIPINPAQFSAIRVHEGFFSMDELREGYSFMKSLGRAGYPLVQLAIRK